MPNSSALQTLRESIRARARGEAQEQLNKPEKPQGKYIKYRFDELATPSLDAYDRLGEQKYDSIPWGADPSTYRQLDVSDERMDEYQQALQQYQEDVEARAETIMGPQQAALDVWQNAREGVEEANQAAMEDRERMLAEIEAYEDDYNEDWINESLDRTYAALQAQKEQSLARAQQQLAAMGRQPDPYIMSELDRRWTSRMMDAMQKRQIQLEDARSRRIENALRLRHKTYMGTQREVLDPARASQIVRRLGQAGSQVEPERV